MDRGKEMSFNSFPLREDSSPRSTAEGPRSGESAVPRTGLIRD
jgi:hypothetical protein